MTTVEQIHNDFDSAVETLEEISKKRQEIADSIEIPQEEKDFENGKWLKEMGFEKTALAVKASEFSKLSKSIENKKSSNADISKRIDKLVQKYQSLFPHNKFILYSQVIKICEKYDLFLGPAKLFKGDIPSKNVEEMKNFPWERYSEEKAALSYTKAVCEQAHSQEHWATRDVKAYICAPYSDFDTEETTTVGKEIYEKTNRDVFEIKLKQKPAKDPDPIILVPVQASELQEVGFIVVTKWGPEASEPELNVPTLN